MKLHVASQGYQSVEEQIRQLIFSLANGAVWIMSWASRVSSLLRFVARGQFVYHEVAAFQVRNSFTSFCFRLALFAFLLAFSPVCLSPLSVLHTHHL